MTGSSAIQSVSFGTYERIAGKARVCAGLRAHVDPEKATKPRFAAEFGKSYPVAILVGPSWRLLTNVRPFQRRIFGDVVSKELGPAQTRTEWRLLTSRLRSATRAAGRAPWMSSVRK